MMAPHGCVALLAAVLWCLGALHSDQTFAQAQFVDRTPEFDAELNPSDVRRLQAQLPSQHHSDNTIGHFLSEKPHENPDIARMLVWLRGLGMLDSRKLTVESDPLSGRGLRMKEGAVAGEQLFAVPVASFLHTHSPLKSARTSRALEICRGQIRVPGFPRDEVELTEAAILVLLERRDPNSFWKPFFDTLPHPSCPFTWSLEELQLLNSSWVVEWRAYFVAAAQANFELCMAHPAFATVLSGDRQADLFAFQSAALLILQRSFGWGIEGLRDFVMIPLLDLVNHRFGVTNNYYYDTVKLSGGKPHDVFLTSAADDVKVMMVAAATNMTAGQPFNIAYNEDMNSVRLLLQYGFVSPSNKNDYVTVKLLVPSEAAPTASETSVLERVHLAVRRFGKEHLNLPLESAVGTDLLFERAFVKCAVVCLGVGAHAADILAKGDKLEEEALLFNNRLPTDLRVLATELAAEVDRVFRWESVPRALRLIAQLFFGVAASLKETWDGWDGSIEEDERRRNEVLKSNGATAVQTALLFRLESKRFNKALAKVVQQVTTLLGRGTEETASELTAFLSPHKKHNFIRTDWPLFYVPVVLS